MNLDEFDVLKASPVAIAEFKKGLKLAFKNNMKPMPKMNLVEWADTFRVLPDNSAEPGPWKTSRVEVARGPMLSATDPNVTQVTIMACVQLLKTELLNNIVGYFIHLEPSPIIFVNPKKEMAEAWSKERFTKMVNAMPVLKDLFNDNRRGNGNTILNKQFPGGQIAMVSARNPTDLASRACRIVCCDEVDKYIAGVEGDPIKIVWERSRTFGDRAKLFVACSPTVEGSSRIELEYFQSDMRVFIQPCVHCDHKAELDWENVIIPTDDDGDRNPEKAFYACPECGSEWSERDRRYSIRNGYWEAKNPKVTHHHGYKCSAFASPFIDVPGMARKFVDCGEEAEALKVFYNTILARTWREKGEQPDWKRMYDNREAYQKGTVPSGVLLITIGIDVQKDYLVYEVVGWGRGKVSWSIDAGVISGKIGDAETKKALTEFLDRKYKTSNGIDILPEKTCIDSGYDTQDVYAFCREYGDPRKVIPVKGDEKLKQNFATPRPVDVNFKGERIARGVMLWGVGVDVVKTQVYRWFNLDKPLDNQPDPDGYCHFPEYEEEFFKQLTAEQLVSKKDNRGYITYIWEKTRRDNHYLDCRVYARAGAAMVQMDRFDEKDWLAREAIFGKRINSEKETPNDEPSAKSEEKAETVEVKQSESKPKPRRKARGNWLNR